jgi:uncharacterized repeat protein (TIGR03803 family)
LFEEQRVSRNQLRRKSMPGKTFLMKRSAMLVLLGFGVLLGAARAQTESVLHSFCARINCNDGGGLQAGLLLDQQGNLYGTTYTGGPYNECGRGEGEGCGLVFKLSPKGKETVLYDFCKRGYPCTDGGNPLAGLTSDQKGNLYGTTEYGGAHGEGVAFKLTPEGKYAVLYSFCARDNCTDGYNPAAGMVLDQKGNLYGTTPLGGADGAGVVFRLTPEGKETVLYSFCAHNNCTDGYGSVAGLVFDQKGNIYGTTEYGGAGDCYGGCGVVFKLTPKDKETVLYSFCPQNCADGYFPVAGLTVDQNGNLYGTTTGGGMRGAGVVFKLTPKGKETVLYNFCAQANCADGETPYAGLVLDQKGNLYGTTYFGGAYESGTAFKLTP